ncbi:MAG TPA: response regulator [Longimicrobiales bacterium]|nr:response regulator [Longimicrobiales bacterium]
MHRLSAADKVSAGFVIALAVVTLIGIASIASIQLFLATSREVSRTHGAITEMHGLLTAMTLAENAQRGYVLTGNDRFLAPYDTALLTVRPQLRGLRARATDPTQIRQLGRLDELVAERLQLMTAVVETRRADGREAAVALLETGTGPSLTDSIRALAASWERQESQRLRNRERAVEGRARFAGVIIGGAALFTLLVVFLSALVIRRDFSERKRAEQALRDSETLLSQFMENLPIGVMVVDAQWQPRFANNAAVDIMGPRVLIDTGERPLPLLLEDGRPYPDARTPVFRALAGDHATIDDAVIDVDGRQVPLEVSAAPVYDASGRIAYAIATFSDISERRRSEEALRAAKNSAEAANRTKSDFLARMSHELRTPLNSVIGFANILLKNRAGNLKEQEIAYLDRILENGKHLLVLINDILDLSKIEAGRIEIDEETVDAGELIRSTVGQWDGQLPEAVRMRVTVPDAEPLTTDAARLRQVLINLIGNAVKFTESGEIHVAAETEPDSRRIARIRVSDTGIGIPGHRLEGIFEAFEQADSTTSRRFGGTGLGLPISRALCELLGYRLEVASEVGAGTTFTIEMLPREVTLPEARYSDTAPEEGGATTDRLVLIVDDEADSRILLTHYVEEFGCRAIATHSGRSAIMLARELKPDLITLDLMMPDVTGWDLLRQLKEDPELARIPVIIVSIVAQESRASLLGALDVLSKPVDRDSLFAVLQRNIGRDGARILVVEDDEDARTLLGEMLSESAAEVRTAANGREALDLLRSFEPDLVITDLLMPEMDGMAFLEVFRSQPAFQTVPVVVITARDLTAEDTERLRRHTDAVLRKGNALETDLRRVLAGLLQEPPGDTGGTGRSFQQPGEGAGPAR